MPLILLMLLALPCHVYVWAEEPVDQSCQCASAFIVEGARIEQDAAHLYLPFGSHAVTRVVNCPLAPVASGCPAGYAFTIQTITCDSSAIWIDGFESGNTDAWRAAQ